MRGGAVSCSWRWFVFIALVALPSSVFLGGNYLTTIDACDWIGSGLDYKESERGVQPVYLRCSQGRIRWKYPHGALRIVLRYGTSGKEFKGCMKAGKYFHGARVYLEGHRTLHVLYSVGDGRNAQLPRCFHSRHGQVALYVEAEPTRGLPQSNLLKRNVADFSYDLQPRRHRPNSIYSDPQEDCQPCSDAELLRHYCVADFLAKGTISGIYENQELSRTELTVRARNVARQNKPVFHSEEEPDFRGMYGTVHVPLACKVKHGSGDFLFMGRMFFDSPVLTCAPRVEEWDAVRELAIRDGTNQCELS